MLPPEVVPAAAVSLGWLGYGRDHASLHADPVVPLSPESRLRRRQLASIAHVPTPEELRKCAIVEEPDLRSNGKPVIKDLNRKLRAAASERGSDTEQWSAPARHIARTNRAAVEAVGIGAAHFAHAHSVGQLAKAGDHEYKRAGRSAVGAAVAKRNQAALGGAAPAAAAAAAPSTIDRSPPVVPSDAELRALHLPALNYPVLGVVDRGGRDGWQGKADAVDALRRLRDPAAAHPLSLAGIVTFNRRCPLPHFTTLTSHAVLAGIPYSAALLDDVAKGVVRG
eukprot:gene23365-1957_t